MPSLKFGSLVDDDGNPFDIPGLEVDPKRRPCHIVVTLRGVYYAGDNVGSTWRFVVAIDGAMWVSPTITLQHEEFHPIGERVYDRVKEHGCGMTHLLVRSIHAREMDGIFFLDDKGQRHDTTAITCSEEGSQRRDIVTVPVAEYPALLSRWPFRRVRNTALLIFFFEIEARCTG